MPIERMSGESEALVIPAFEEDLDNIQKLDDEPNDVGGLTSAQLKEEFDRAGNAIKGYLNDTLLPAISETVAEREVWVEKEAQMDEAEAGRVSAEEARVEAENLRAAAETDRDTAESERQTAEAAREDAGAGIIARATAEADRAKAAADRAEEVVGDNYATLDENGKLKESQKPDYTAEEVGARADTWNPLPVGGTAGQVLKKAADEDYAVAWGEDAGGLLPQVIVTAPEGSTVTVTKAGAEAQPVSAEGGTWVFNLPEYGDWAVEATMDGKRARATAIVDAVKRYQITLEYTNIYGVEWDGTSTTALSRTDAAEGFTDPVPYYSGLTGYGSPFDALMPWAGMVRVTDSEAGELVKIPKFWYKWTKSGNTLKLQIADKEAEGFYVSPAHADRGDGKGERDEVYVGRYHCGESAYKSVSGQKPKVSITRATARTAIHNLGNTLWQTDMAMRLTIQMLYLVEYADWNSQATIGGGCSQTTATASAVFACGGTDGMPYHTGNMQNAHSAYGTCQYRYIEGLWDNCYDWMDGCYYNSDGLNIILNPANFASGDSQSGGELVGLPSSSYPTVMDAAEAGGVQWLYPTTAGGSDSTYVPDYWNFYASYPCLHSGGDYSQSQSCGLFYVNYYAASNSSAYIGSRLQKLP